MSTRIKTLAGAVVAGLVLMLAAGSVSAQETNPSASSGCCCKKMAMPMPMPMGK